jgi:hypothetical protein
MTFLTVKKDINIRYVATGKLPLARKTKFVTFRRVTSVGCHSLSEYSSGKES